jgi:hypothetical protein
LGQIVGAKRTKDGTYVIEVKPLKKERISESGETIQIAGTNGWAETLPGVYDENGEIQLTAVVQIRKKNKRTKEKENEKAG